MSNSMSVKDTSSDVSGSVERATPTTPRRTLWQSLRVCMHILQVRLRFVLVFLLAFVVVGRWEVLRNYWDALTTTAGGVQTGLLPVSNDTEYFCPMDPGVVSDWPGKCSICNMALVRRKKGEAVPLPNGIVARMQFSPYRLQLAVIQTSPVTYQPLWREVITVGRATCDERRLEGVRSPRAGVVETLVAESLGSVVERGDPLLTIRDSQVERGKKGEEIIRSASAGSIVSLNVSAGEAVAAGTLLAEVCDLSKLVVLAEIFENDLLFVSAGQPVEATSEALPGRAPWLGRVRLVRSAGQSKPGAFQAVVEIDNPQRDLRPGQGVFVRIKTSI